MVNNLLSNSSMHATLDETTTTTHCMAFTQPFRFQAGRRRFTVVSAMQYTGQIQDGQMHGKGTLVYPNSERYEVCITHVVLFDGWWQRRPTSRCRLAEFCVGWLMKGSA